MKLLLFIPLVFLLSVGSVSAQKCKYEKDMIDAVTEMKIKRTRPVDIARVNNNPLLVKAQCIGKNKYLKIRYYMYEGFKIRENEPLEFFFTDNTSLEITAREMPESKTSGGFTQVSELLVYDLTPEQYLMLMEKPLAEIKYYVETGGFVRKEVRKRDSENLMHILKCILLDTDNF
ncbi:MAG: hypothetical protein R6U85_03870 [Salinivirgaceae bacterium]